MNQDKLRVDSIFLAAVDKSSDAERSVYLDGACGSDQGLRERVERLLAAHGKVSSFLESPAPALLGTVDEPAVTERPGTVIGPYKLLEQIGEGGFGLVFMAEQQQPIRRKVAVKVLKPGMDTKQVIARFEAERQALALMDHPNIAKVHEAGETASGRPYFVMELVKGIPITDFCDQNQVPIRDRLELFVPVCQAVQHAHQKGIIHRDIKPTNVMVTLHDGIPVPKIIDFGIAKALGQQLTDKTLFTQFAQLIGTPLYMSPEQAELGGLDIDTRSDIYSLGVLLYELLTGTTPFDKERLKEAGYDQMRRIIREEEPPKPSTRISTLGQAATTVSTNRKSDPKRLSASFRGELDWIVMKALEKDRNRRYETASAFAADVQRYLNDEPVQACPPSAWYRFGKFARRNKMRLAFAACLFLAVTVMAGTIGWAVRDRAGRQAEVERRARDDLATARSLIAGNELIAARQKLAEARGQLANDRSGLASLAAEVEAAEAELDRFQQFLDLIDRAHEAETAPVVEAALAADGSYGRAPALARARPGDPRVAAAVPFLLQALERYVVLERDDWNTTLEGRLLGTEQLEHIRRTVYEELLWLAGDVLNRQEEHRSGRKLSTEAAARAAVVYLDKAESAHPPTQALYALRAHCRKALGDEAGAQADRQLTEKTPPTLALDHYLRGEAAYDAKKLAEGVQFFEAALRLEPTHYWSLMKLGYCLCDLGQGPEDFAGAARVFTGCILKRPDHAHAYFCRGVAYSNLRRYEEARADFSKFIELVPKQAEPWNSRGVAYLTLRQWDKAVADLSKAIELDPKNAITWNNRGGAHSELRQWDKGVVDFSKAIELDPNFASAHCGLGYALLGKGQIDEAIAACRKAIEIAPQLAPAHNMLGLALWDKGRPDEAIAAYRKAIEIDPKYPGPRSNLGHALLMKGQLDEAIAQFRKAIEIDPKLGPPHSGLGEALRGKGRLDDAIAACRKAIEIDPEQAPAHNNLGNALYSKGRLDEAIAEYRKAIEIDPKFVMAHVNLGLSLGNKGRRDEAIAAYRKAIEIDPKFALAHNELGVVLAQTGRKDEAIAEYHKTIEIDPKFVNAHVNLGLSLDNKGRLDEAIAEYRKAIELAPNVDWWVHLRLGIALREKGRLDEAIAECREAIRLKPDGAPAHVNLGIALRAKGQLDEAISECRKAIEIDPKLAWAHSHLGDALDDKGRLDEAIAAYRKAIELDPKQALAHHGLGNALYKKGQPDEAIAEYRKAIEIDPKYARAHSNLGNALRQKGRLDEAISECRKAIEIDPKLAWAHKLLGDTLYDKGRLNEAIAELKEAVGLNADNANLHNWLAWLLATCPERKLRDGARAVELAKKAVELAPQEGNFWNTLGVAQYRAGDWKGAIEALNKSIDLRKGGDSSDWLFLAMAHWQLGEKDQARQCYDRAVQWIGKNQQALEKDKPYQEELRRFRAEAEELLGIKDK